MPHYLERPGKPRLAYEASVGENETLPWAMFCGGLRSNMTGTKATFLDAQCRARGQSFVRFDYSGHGQSGGEFSDGTIGAWLDDAQAIFETLTQGPGILIGSSMGGWIGLLLALRHPQRVRSFIGIAAAPDFTLGIEAALDDSQRALLHTQGYIEEENKYDEPYLFTRALLEEGHKHALLGRPIAYEGPVRLIQGMKDASVPWQTAHRIKNALTGPDCAVCLIEEGDHNLNRPQDLALLDKTLVDLAGRI